MKIAYSGERVRTSQCGWPAGLGAILLAAGAMGIGSEAWNGLMQPDLLVLGFAMLLFCVGALLLAYRKGIEVDRSSGRGAFWRGFVVPVWKQPFDFTSIEAVRMGRVVGTGGKPTFALALVGAGGKEIQFAEACGKRAYGKARAMAEQVAGPLGLAVHDVTGKEKRIRDAGTLDESLRERAARTGDLGQLPPAPESLPGDFRQQGDVAVFVRPRPGLLNPSVLVVAGVCLAVVGSFAVMLFLNAGSPQADVEDMIGLIAGTAICSLLAFIAMSVALSWAMTEERIEISPRTVVRERRGLLRTKREEMAAEEAEEVVCEGGQVTLRCDRGPLALAFSPPVAEWFAAVLRVVLSLPDAENPKEVP